jgi:acetoin utilization deacetylase AcuC-like enzyme
MTATWFRVGGRIIDYGTAMTGPGSGPPAATTDPDRARPVLLSHPSSLTHDPGPHPEQPARIAAITRELDRRDSLGCRHELSPAVERDALLRVHTAAHVDRIEALSARGGGHIDLDTAMSAGSWNAALHAAGGAVRMTELLVAGEAPFAFSIHRPPGHHATRAQAMGFCLFNNVAVAAAHALGALGLRRVMILDWDVHHGNGTNDIFYASDEVLFVSIHQWPLYPGSGAADEAGSGAGAGHTVNLPVPPGSGDAEFASLAAHVVVPLAERYAPQLILVSAGYDAHRADPLADCTVTEAGYATMTATVRALAESLGAPAGFVLEGGYHLDALARSVAATIAVLAADTVEAPDPPASPLASAALARLQRLGPWR